MQVLLHVFYAFLMPTVSYAMIKSNFRSHAAGTSSTEDQWWPFNSFGENGVAKGTFKQELENYGDTQYFGMIEVGGQKLRAVIDTGSFELLVFGTNCTACGNKTDLYDYSKSKKATASNFGASHSFGSGTTSSKRAIDNFKIGHFTVPNQSFWEVYDADMPILSEGRFQAIFGVGPPSSAIEFVERDDGRARNKMRQMKRHGKNVTKEVKDMVQHYDDMLDLMKNVTSVYENLDIVNMSICLGEKTGSPGYFFWDDHATQTSPEKFEKLHVHGDYYWSASLGDVHLAKDSVLGDNYSKDLRKLAKGTIEIGCATSNCSAIIDTGTSLLVAPNDVVDMIWNLSSQWEAAGGSCEDLSQLPELKFKLNGKPFSLPPEAYMGFVSGDIHEGLAMYMPRFYNKHKNRKIFSKQRSKHMKQKHVAKAADSSSRSLRGKTDKSEAASEDDDLTSDQGTSYCEPLIMSMDADSQFGQLWIMGMPFFRKYYTSFEFAHENGKLPQAATMSFSEQDGECRPGNAPQSIKAKTTTDVGSSFSARQVLQGPRRAQLNVETSKIFVPHLVRDAHRMSLTSKVMRPFVHI